MADVKSTHIGKCIVRLCAFDKNKKKNYDQQIALVEMEKIPTCISFLAVQVIFICVYINN